MYRRASLEELMEFANKVREAGGGNPLDALMPSVPENPKACLIANNLNFNCMVKGAVGLCGAWVMVVDEPIRSRIADALGLVISENDGGVVLPENIGAVAAEFDHAGTILADLYADPEYLSEHPDALSLAWKAMDPDDRELLLEFLPYIEASKDEAYSLASHVDENGRITL